MFGASFHNQKIKRGYIFINISHGGPLFKQKMSNAHKNAAGGRGGGKKNGAPAGKLRAGA